MASLKLFITALILISGVLNASAMDVDLWQVPMPDFCAVVYKDKPLMVNEIAARVTRLESNADKGRILEFYKDALARQGFQLREDITLPAVYAFSKAGKFIYVGIQDNPAGIPIYIYLVSSPQELALCRILSDYFLQDEIAADAPGEDMADIVRYPGSKRRMNIFSPEGNKIIIYEARAIPQAVASFYDGQLKSTGWRKDNSFEAPEAGALFFKKADSQLLIVINRLSAEEKGRTMIMLQRSER